MARALLLVDLSKDFVYPDGALNCGEAGLGVIPYCRSLVKEFVETGDLIIDARDLHDPEDYEIASGLFPPHNLRHSEGQKLIDELREELNGHEEKYVYIAKKHYNACQGTDLFNIIRQYHITEIHVAGVCTDICVRYTVNGLYDFKTTEHPDLQIVVHREGVASFNEAGHQESLQHFPRVFGAKVV
ncbi:cysteine hydrolase [Alicyclobacillus cycloheptanicus]|uniref:Nicotinamidase-related amidase n=1 Tax=Alicyclobacillus cycloheptanicus TaxID=1457 RepID=A0ABT9XKG5_9BACL|nr:isochorismatase family cysteine hydrolase [Alicyclobacillus cycloheptanicus]MDQ0190768.1 nicotinamidase-related amidase [Alicyclobacillus cycloheptanicus]WDL99848.1 cysteine hydrolase [Alicyclobacillus cycloheptanicus]